MTTSKNKKTGLFFGSFNPIHLGHMVIARYMLEFTDLDEVWLVISPHNPLKEKKTLLADNHRYYMVNLAVEDIQGLKASSIEFDLPQPSYTIDTLAYLGEKYPDKSFILIAGTDILPTFHKWKNHEKILEYYQLYIYPRPDNLENPFKDHPSIHEINAPMMEISASFIRNAIRKKRDISFLLPPKVAEHIDLMNFYK